MFSLDKYLHNKSSSMGHAMDALHVKSIIHLNLLCNSNIDKLNNIHTISSKTNELKG